MPVPAPGCFTCTSCHRHCYPAVLSLLCRVRPLASPGEQLAVSFPYPGSIAVHPSDKRVQEFEFDGVFPQASSQVCLCV